MKFWSKRTIALLVGVAALAAFGWFFVTERPISVTVVETEAETAIRVYGLGTVEARVVSKIGFEVGAALADLLVDSNDSVTKGQSLALLHGAEQDARVARAEAGVAASTAAILKAEASIVRAQAVLAQRETANTRQQALASRSAIAAKSAEEAQRDVAVAAAELTVAQSDVAVIRAQSADATAALQFERTLLAHHTLTAPFDAVIVQRHAEAGTVVRAGDVILAAMPSNCVECTPNVQAGPLKRTRRSRSPRRRGGRALCGMASHTSAGAWVPMS